jgi:hypothetical protein
MAVRVMVAPAIANGAIEKNVVARQREKVAPAKPKRRRSSVYDADGNEVFITLMCLKCHKMRPLSQFGLRKMADGAIRNQPWCRTCRSAAGTEKPRRKEATEAVDSPEIEAPVAAAPAAADPSAPQKRTGSVAAEVAAALAAGMRR